MSDTVVAVARRWPNRIRLLRTERGLELGELAVLAGITKSQLSRYERGLTVPGWANASAIAGALGVELAELGIEQQAQALGQQKPRAADGSS